MIKKPLEPATDDWADMPEFARRLGDEATHTRLLHSRKDTRRETFKRTLVITTIMVASNEWETTIRAYQASIAFVDRQIGLLYQCSRKEPTRNRETIVMLVSDHGWHLGEKKHWCKGAIWEQTTQDPVHGSRVRGRNPVPSAGNQSA